ncbi:GTP cyclohydrolase FolE2 [Acinetobacter soli]|uniref:GTP cyclohydrolase FolE2 n=2 Tax=Acinetobacter TaxID=469 RepID=UPI0032B33C31
MNSSLPDVCVSQLPNELIALKWVGMEGIDLPLSIQQFYYPLSAKVDIYVNLPKSDIKGIHMSRLYRLLNELHDLDASVIHSLLQDIISSHQDCGSDAAKIVLRFDLMLSRSALVSADLNGWKSYPVCIKAELINHKFQINYAVDVSYSSTCPCSAALSRQLIAQAFELQFKDTHTLPKSDVKQWLEEHATYATPHSQRSIAQIKIETDDAKQLINLTELIDKVEQALKTPTQTAVKRADEQAFAQLNGQNLMFVEDAVRRLSSELDKTSLKWSIKVIHQESLHAHDAVAISMSS